MNKIERLKPLAGFEEDFARWSIEQAAMLRARRADGIDWENVAEEIDGVGGSQKDEIENRLGVLVQHLLKWRHQPDRRSSGWKGTIVEQRNRIARRIARSPSLKSYPAEVLPEIYESARLLAAEDTGLSEAEFPIACPFAVKDILNRNFYPD